LAYSTLAVALLAFYVAAEIIEVF